ncbi:iron-sulfur cluster carrier protein ApbC [Halopseudomonas phragmitis]|uniref:Iron-sulfur cluster carrier protein n=2 Tax=Pseudomonadaceae TaxID=135621 RepID=A0A1V0B8D4_9GAMM|nr:MULTISPECIES: iron-sulfur cluster carrier protein ApbC [Pseudomonadaceae]AQZ96150.1 Fe-S-binding ATPase [Halopseudomonas phragmitis]PAU89096.1 iron-sulfur cluster carrier protein ApbC [Pseudomonas sp. WN033]RHW20988.1 iron-sulfur cluster carrier protein ApbC [Pseudomonas jilinensis]
MHTVDRSAVERALGQYQDPYLQTDLISAGCLRDLRIEGGKVEAELVLGYAAAGIRAGIEQMLQVAVESVAGVESATISVACEVASAPAQGSIEALRNVKNIIAVASGKGGVGKSTTAVNLALALAREGARVGVLDADIYGPSMGLMLGLPEGTRPQVKDQKLFIPPTAHGVQVMSMAFLVDDNTPVVWRGPMVSGALMQLLTQTAWDDLDYLVVDMPPGTGDIQLTLAQKVPVTGAVIVTTPQDLALLDAKKGIEMFNKVNIPVLGVVENMAIHICSNCGHAEHLFGEGGGERLAEQYGVDLLASMPLSMMIREQADGGTPTVVAEPECQISMIYQDMARHVGARIAERAQAPAMPSISISDD